MDKWSFNMSLLGRLSKVLDISEAEIARRCGMTQQVLNRYTGADITVSVQVLLKICNALRMPAHYFVSEDNNHAAPSREVATIPADRWQPVEWDTQAVELTFGDGEGQIYWKDVAKAMGVTSQKPHDRFLLRTRFPIDDFLQTCNRLSLSPFRFLIDPNREVPARRKRSATVPGASPSGKTPPPHPDIAALCHRIDTLEHTVADLQKQYADLLRAHEALARRVNVNIESINNSSVNIATDSHK